MLRLLSTMRIKKLSRIILFLCLATLSILFITRQLIKEPRILKEQNLTQYVNAFIGTSNEGLTFPGAAYPFGMVAWSPDTNSKPYSGGYNYQDIEITGFSLTHFSGGGLVTGMQIPVMPYTGTIIDSPTTNLAVYYSSFSHNAEEAHPGYYKITLDNKVTVELTATARTGFGRFTFPSSEESKLLINKGGVSIKRDESVKSETNIISNHEMTGFAEDSPGHPVYFYAVFDRPFISFGTWDGSSILDGSKSTIGTQSGAFASFDTTKNNIVQMKVGISYVSISNAKENLKAENSNWDFLSIRQAADNAWNKMLNKIQIVATQNQKDIFYSALYHALLSPNIFSDVNGEYMGFDNKVHQQEKGHAQYQYFPNWDLYRNQIQLLAILDPDRTSDMMQSLVNDAQQGNGTIPIWTANNTDYGIMGGDNGIPVVASAYAFGAVNFDTKEALNAILDPRSKQNNSNYKKQGYLAPSDSYRSVSENIEFATDNFSTAGFASALGNENICHSYLQMSHNWQNLFNNSSKQVQPRNSDGTWIKDFSPINHIIFEEGDSSIYTLMVPHDFSNLFSLLGGKTQAIDRLNELFSTNHDYMHNEPAFVIPWAYAFAGKPSNSQFQVNKYLQNFNDQPQGLPDNDDAGALSSWYIFSSLGLYPAVPGVGGFVIGTPLFNSTIYLDNGKTINIKAQPVSKSIYIKDLSVNGKNYTSSWLPWDKIKNGGTLKFNLSNSPSAWETKDVDLPPVFTSPAMCKESLSSSIFRRLQQIIPFLIQQLHK